MLTPSATEQYRSFADNDDTGEYRSGGGGGMIVTLGVSW